jgi:SAM-dependent methyltransferase
VPGSEPALADIGYQLLRCGSCGTAVTVGQPPPALHESGAYRPGAPRLSTVLAPVLRAFDRRRLALLRPLVDPGARLLDAGAGRGRFVATARAAGFDAFGIEPSPRGVAPADVTPVSIAEAEIEPGSVDAVTLWHVLEHLDDPGTAVGRIFDWTAPRGALLVGVPNLASWQARIGGARWYHLDVPRHRVHFTPSGLSALLSAHGFAPVHTHHLLFEHNPFGMWQSLVNGWTRHPSYLYNVLKRNAPFDWRDAAVTVAAVPAAPLAAALELLAGLERHGGTIAVLARRVE